MPEEFGKDEGLMHEAMVTLRKASASTGVDLRTWFSKVAHDETFARSILAPAPQTAITVKESQPEAAITVDGVKYHPHPNGGGLVAETAKVALTAYVGPFAIVKDKAEVLEDARIEDRAVVYDSAQVSGEARIYDLAMVYGNARVGYGAEVGDEAQVFGDAKLSSDAQVLGNAQVFGNAHISRNVRVLGKAKVSSGWHVI